MSTPAPTKRLLHQSAVGRRYGRDPRTVAGWKAKRALPPPDAIIAGHDYWYETTLDEHDRRSAAERAKAAK